MRNWLAISHRGTPREFPDNTMQGFQRALEYGCQMMECDVQRAADGVLVLAHDDHVISREGHHYRIADHTSQELARLDLGRGEGVPTLLELATWISGKCALMPDMKVEGDGVEEGVIAALECVPPSDRIVTGASQAARARFRALDPELPLSLTLNVQYGHLLEEGNFEERIQAIDTNAVTWEHPLITPERVTALHARGLQVYAWTVDEPTIMQRLLEAGVDGIISNRPDLLQQLQTHL